MKTRPLKKRLGSFNVGDIIEVVKTIDGLRVGDKFKITNYYHQGFIKLGVFLNNDYNYSLERLPLFFRKV
jgi:hypothetical protein